MHLRLIGAVLVLLGLVAAGTGVASATLWRPADEVRAEALAPGASTLLVTDPGVLELLAETVTARASGPQGQPIVIAVGREADVIAWVGLDPHARVTGLADDATLVTVPGQPVEPPVETPAEDPADDAPEPSHEATTAVDATDEEPAATESDAASSDAAGTAAADDAGAANAPDPAGSDMWIAEVTGETTAELEWQARPGRWSLLVASTGPEAGAPTLELTWPREVVTPWFRPGLWIGGSLVVVGLGLVLVGWLRSRHDDEWTEVDEVEVPEVPSGPLTRRQLRELEAARAAGRGRAGSRRRPARARATAGAAAATSESVLGTEPVPGSAPAEVPAADAPADHSSARPEPFTPSQPARRAGADESSAPTSPAVPTPSWAPTSTAGPVPSHGAPAADAHTPAPAGGGSPAQPAGPAPYTPRFVPAAPSDDAPDSTAVWEGAAPADSTTADSTTADSATADSDVAWLDRASQHEAPAVSWPSIASGTSPAPEPSRTPPAAPPTVTPATATPATAPAPAAGPVDPTPGADVERTAVRRSRTGKFFSRRRRGDELPDPGPHGDGQPAPAAGAGAAPAAQQTREPGTEWAGGSSFDGGQAPAPSASSPGGTTSADAWRARWGFVEMPSTPPVATDEADQGDDEQDGGRR